MTSSNGRIDPARTEPGGGAAAAAPRVLMVTGAYYPEISSSGLQCQHVARLLDRRVDVRVLTTGVDRTLPSSAVVEGVPVSRIHVDVSSRLSKAVASIRMIAAMARLGRRADVVHLHGFSGKNVVVTAMARLLFGRPVIMSLHTSGFDEPESIARQGRLAWWAFTSADLYLSVSPHLVTAFLAAGLPARKIRQVPNGIDLTRFSPADRPERERLRRRLGLPVDRPMILFVGFFSREKQPHVLFDAWRLLNAEPAPSLVFVGATKSSYFEVDGDLAGSIRWKAAGAGVDDRLFFVDPTHDVHDYYRAADLFVLPSSREGLPVALLEAMASGLPCVASRLPGATDVVITDGDDGVLVAPGDVEAFASAIDRLLGDHQAAAALGARARATVTARYSDADVAERWLDAYETVMRAKTA